MAKKEYKLYYDTLYDGSDKIVARVDNTRIKYKSSQPVHVNKTGKTLYCKPCKKPKNKTIYISPRMKVTQLTKPQIFKYYAANTTYEIPKMKLKANILSTKLNPRRSKMKKSAIYDAFVEMTEAIGYSTSLFPYTPAELAKLYDKYVEDNINREIQKIDRDGEAHYHDVQKMLSWWGFADYIKVNPRWLGLDGKLMTGNHSEYWIEIMELINNNMLVNNFDIGVDGVVNKDFLKFFFANHDGMVDKKEVTTTNNNLYQLTSMPEAELMKLVNIQPTMDDVGNLEYDFSQEYEEDNTYHNIDENLSELKKSIYQVDKLGLTDLNAKIDKYEHIHEDIEISPAVAIFDDKGRLIKPSEECDVEDILEPTLKKYIRGELDG